MARAAEKQFWGCPELVEGLLPFMDTLSVRRLVQVSNILALVMLIMVIFMEPLTEAWPSLLQSWQSCNIHYHQNDHIMAMVRINIFMVVFIFTLVIIFLTMQAYPPILNIVLGKIMWNKLTRRVCYDNRTSYYKIHEEIELEDMRIQVGYI